MINRSNKIIYLKEEQIVYEEFLKIVNTLLIKYEANKYFCSVFQLPFLNINRDNICIFLNDLYQIFTVNSQNIGSKIRQVLRKYVKTDANLDGFVGSKIIKIVRLLYFMLWADECVVLTSKMNINFNSERDYVYKIAPETYKFFCNYENEDCKNKKLSNSDRFLLRYKGTKFLIITDWTRFGKILIDDYIIHSALSSFAKKKIINCYDVNNIPVGLMMSEVLSAHGELVSYTQSNLDYVTRMKMSYFFNKFVFENKDCVNVKASYFKQEYVKFVKQKSINRLKKIQNRNKNESNNKKESVKKYDVTTHENILSYIRNLKSGVSRAGDWMCGYSPYPGRRDFYIGDISKIWYFIYKKYLENRKKVKNYESDSLKYGLNVLFDYIFLYLPLRNEIFRNDIIDIPVMPKQFIRKEFVTPIERECPFLSLLEFSKLKCSTNNSVYQSLNAIKHFFDFIKLEFNHEDFVGPYFENPISLKFDAPRTYKYNKTTKVLFQNDIYKLSCQMLMTIEYVSTVFQKKYGVYGFESKKYYKYRMRKVLDFEDLGCCPIFFYNNEMYKLNEVPNFLNYYTDISAGGEIRNNGAITVLRLVLCIFLTGLRTQSVQWLDLNEYNFNNVIRDDEDLEVNILGIKSLTVSTDKVRRESWISYVTKQVIEILDRESDYQKNRVDEYQGQGVWYEDRVDSIFGQIIPVFRSKTTKPFSDNCISLFWRNYMKFVEYYLNKYLKIKCKLIEKVDKKDRAIVTPHSLRAQFITTMADYMPLEDVQMLVGHINLLSTHYYYSPSKEVIKNKLASASDYWDISTKYSPVFIKPSSPESKFRIDFDRDRLSTIANYHCINLNFWTDTKYTHDEVFKLLQSTPYSQISFHDSHICPVNDVCPKEVLDEIGVYRRCGVCPLSIKSLDHLTAISAKKRLFFEKIKSHKFSIDLLIQKKEPSNVIKIVKDQALYDMMEFCGWSIAECVLLKKLHELQMNFSLDGSDCSQNNNLFFSFKPEVVSNHLSILKIKSTDSEFIRSRIIDSSQFPLYTTDQIRIISSGLLKRITASSVLSENCNLENSVDCLARLVDEKLFKSALFQSSET